MHGVASLLAAASGAYVLARLFRVPPVPLLLLAGVALSALADPSPQVLERSLILGVAFVLFVVGLELDPRRLRAQRRAALRVGVAQFAVLGLLGFGAALALGFGTVEAGWVALALLASSTLVGVRMLQRRRQMFEPFGRLVIGVILLQDVLVILAVPVMTGVGEGWEAVGTGLSGVVLLGVLALAIRRWGAPLVPRVADEPELLLLGSLAILFAFVGLSHALELPIVVGAFLAGASLSRFPVNGIVRTELAPVGDFFAVIFFVSLGALVRMPTPAELLQAAVLALVVLVCTPVLVAVIAERAGLASRPAVEAGLILSQTSEISLVVVFSGMIHGRMSESLFVVVALVTLATMLLTPLLATDDTARRLTRLRPRRGGPDPGRPSGHVLLLGAGSAGMPLLEDLVLSGCPVVVVDQDPAVVRRLTEAGVPSLRGEATDPAVLRDAGAERARVVSSTIRRPRDNAELLRLVGGRVPVLVQVFEEEDAQWVLSRGGEPVLYSRATADGLMEWFAERADELEAGVRLRGG